MNEKHNPLYYMNKIDEYLDNALSENECSEFIRDVQQDPLLNQMLNKERNIRTMIKNQFQRQKVDNSFINAIKKKLYS
jgi:hypothetical protein